MWNRDWRRWEKREGGGGLASKVKAFIFLFCWSANVFKDEQKARWEKVISWKRKLFFVGPDAEAQLSFLVSHKCPPSLIVCFLNSLLKPRQLDFTCVLGYLFLVLCCCLQSPSSSIRGEVTCALAGKLCPFLECRLLLSLCHCVGKDSESWKRPLFRVALSMVTGP